jgi:cell division protein FtsQ
VSALAARLVLPLRRPLRAAVSLRPRTRRRLLAALAACVVLGAFYMLWFRDSGLVKVRHVSVSGLTASDTGGLRRALADAAGGMTTLHLDHGRLDRVAALYPVVERLELSPDFPHTLRIHVVERRAAAIAVSGHSRVPVAADGSLLRGLPVHGALPVVKLPGPATGERLNDHAALVAVRVTGAAPRELLPRLRAVKREPGRGIVIPMRRGPDLIFGSTSRLAAKWAAVARVLAAPASRGANYIDVRLPERPAGGGLTTATTPPPDQPAAPAPTTAPPSTSAPPQSAPPTGTTPSPSSTAPTSTAPQQAPAPPAAAGPGGSTGAGTNPQP